ncbi:hypothetical protein ASPACDRAFT_1853205 [Aspergillus aculeatus ATCC 16872]|uniref:Late endosomal/lysosomal adaptor and MAPK and MTOR activator-domain-containing protein n=1 Tax=Aspergillus aculeatus (strain ATCC 16872 / CBS 172.66 / WB 5094) TaxID=690307 RepID=A0A1L9X2T5_ASPA1|nr:uncharacterized protein ASPACDRAFT_1853205 [Aspergillus aculeatus ATCC 16872]OJK02629.1 hypothetical protein ASPACDRAFT_1853205 [Aspergillus aculeatus ATCC 16872]
MGICASCLGRSPPESQDGESSRLLEEDIYNQPGYGYGSLNNASPGNHPDPGYLKREREALEAICQRASDSVIDIWSIQPQPHLQPHATLPSAVVAPSTSTSEAPPPVKVTKTDTTPPRAPRRSAASPKPGGTVPKHWGEVVINTRKNRSRPGSSTDEDGSRDVFGVLKVT